MKRGRLFLAPWARIATAMAVIAVGVRLLVPVGFMLDTPNRAGALPALVICTGHGALTVAVDADGRPADPHRGPAPAGAEDHTCAFAAAAVTYVAPVLEDLAAPPTGADAERPLLPVSQRPGLGLAAPPPPTTGPPSII